VSVLEPLEAPGLPNQIIVDREGWVDQARSFKDQGMRFMTLTCLHREDGFEVLAHYDHDLTLHTVRLHVPNGETLPTLTAVYSCAFLPENEVQDMFGLKVEGLDIDYSGKFFITDKFEAPPLLKGYGCTAADSAKPEDN